MAESRKRGEIEWVRLGDVMPRIAAPVADIEIGIRHEGPGLQRRWSFLLQRLRHEELRRIVKAREGLDPEIAPELFDGKIVRRMKPAIDLSGFDADAILAKLADTSASSEKSVWCEGVIVELVAIVKALQEPREVEEVIIPPVRDDSGNVRFVTQEGLAAWVDFATQVVAESAAGIRGGSTIDGETDARKIAEELRRLGVVEVVLARVMEVQSLTRAERFPAAHSRDVR